MVPCPYGNLYSLIFPDRAVRELLPVVALRTAFGVAGVGVVAPPLDPLPVRGGDGCCYWPGGGILDGRARPIVWRAASRERGEGPLGSSVLRVEEASPPRRRGRGGGRWRHGPGEGNGAS